jgi:hypothetical protein
MKSDKRANKADPRGSLPKIGLPHTYRRANDVILNVAELAVIIRASQVFSFADSAVLEADSVRRTFGGLSQP